MLAIAKQLLVTGKLGLVGVNFGFVAVFHAFSSDSCEFGVEYQRNLLPENLTTK